MDRRMRPFALACWTWHRQAADALISVPYNPAMQPTPSQTVLLAFVVGVSLLLERLCRQLWAADRYRYAYQERQLMNKTSKVSFLTLILVLIGISACQVELEEPLLSSEQEAIRIPAEFVVGSYEVIGRYPDSEQLYSGTVEINVSDTESNALSITRTIGGIATRGKGTITTTTSDAIVVMRVEFEEEAGMLEATYLIASDLDNYARLTGYVYAEDERTSLPGIEVLFNDHYRDQ